MRLHTTALPELTAEVITPTPIFSQGTYKLPSAMPASMDEDNQVYPIAAPQILPQTLLCSWPRSSASNPKWAKSCATQVYSITTLSSQLWLSHLWRGDGFRMCSQRSQRIGFRNPCFTTSPTPPPHTQRCGDSQCTQMCSILNQSQDILNAHNLQALKKRMLDTHLC